MFAWYRVCRRTDLRSGRPHCVELEGRRLVLVRRDDRVDALDARCPHAGGPLERGWIEGEQLVCPLHGWRFRLSDGRCTSVPGESIRAYRCALRDGEVWVEL